MAREGRRKIKLFTLAEANQTLPLVRRIVEDIARLHDAAVEARGRMEALAQEGKTIRAQEAHDRLEDLVIELTGFIAELESLGCQCKDTARGLVDFPARVGGRTVLLCWRRGEPEIKFWHELDAGFGGRRPVQGVFA
jgi:hypothetical protein